MRRFADVVRYLIASFKLVVVLDVFARMPLGAKVFLFEPTAEAAADLFRKAVPATVLRDTSSPTRARSSPRRAFGRS